MKKIINSRILLVIVCAIVFTSIGVIAANISASEIDYKDGKKVSEALNELYGKTSTRTLCMLLSGTKNTVSAKYHCELGDGVLRSFYVLAVNGDTVKLIMEKNLSDEIGSSYTMNYDSALHFFDENNPGYSIKQQWLTRVQSVELPDAQDIANAGGMNNGTTTSWNVNNVGINDRSYFGVNSISDTSKRTNYKWLYNYLKGCISIGGCDYEYPSDSNYATGYWTKDIISNTNNEYAWVVGRYGVLDYGTAANSGYSGVRPVITVSKSNLAG